jgi:hypothetical protein
LLLHLLAKNVTYPDYLLYLGGLQDAFRVLSFTQYYETCNSTVTNDTLIRVIRVTTTTIIIIIDGMRLLRLYGHGRSTKDKF